ncbi:Na+/H+ antiporter [Ktedonobacteria bacterium brp13]|nr:Na+/H+ antiporter [Ktedonobacteria bacterium brp13]
MSITNLVIIVMALLVAVIVLVTVADRLHIPYPIFLVVGGLVLSFIPFIPNVHLTQAVVFILFVPPLLLWEAINISLRGLWANFKSIVVLVFGLVITTTLLVGVIGHVVIGLTWTEAFVLGAVVSPTDAVAANAIAQRLKLPGRIITILEGESLFNDATGLVLFTVALSTLNGEALSPLHIGLQFVFISIGGIGIGLVIGFIVNFIRNLVLDDATLENTLLLLTSFAVYLIAQEVGTSGILAVVAAGLVLGSDRLLLSSSYTRLQTEQFWSVIVFILNSLLFILVGLQLYDINKAVIQLYSPATLFWYAFAIVMTVIVLRLVWCLLVFYLPLRLFRKGRADLPSFGSVLIVGWSGMRGGISLAAVLALPANFPSASLVIFLVYCVILVTLIVQGLSLPWLIKKLHLSNEDVMEVMEMKARLAMARAAVHALDDILEQEELPAPTLESLRTQYSRLSHLLAERLKQDELDKDQRQNIHRRVASIGHAQREMVEVERQALEDLFRRHEIPEEIARRLNHELDLNEVLVLSRQGKGKGKGK